MTFGSVKAKTYEKIEDWTFLARGKNSLLIKACMNTFKLIRENEDEIKVLDISIQDVEEEIKAFEQYLL